jgi:iron complex outermembrane receptor protein
VSWSNGFGVSFRSYLLASMSTAALATASPAFAANDHQVDLPAGSLQGSLAALANETGEQLVFTPALVAGRNVPALSGRYDVDAALSRLLAGTDIEATRAGPRLVVLRRHEAAAANHTTTTAQDAPARPFANDPRGPSGPPTSLEPAPPIVTQQAPATSSTTVEAVEVTGTLIRGAGQGPSPLKVIDRNEMERSGEITVAGVLNQLPQVFGGQDTEVTVAVGADTAHQNVAYGTGVNLRGLGTSSTLVLINGRRVGASGLAGNFVDISTLPAIAVQRVEVLLDGASATYGADAVGGVVNVILRRDLNGGELQASAGQAAGATAQEYQVGGVFGRTWSGGGALVAFEYYQRGNLAAADRDYTASADLRPFGGTDHRLTNAFPGNIVGVNPATGISGPFYGIPAGQNGIGLTPTSFRPGQLNLQSPQLGVDLLPATRRESIYAAFHQELTPSIELSGDFRYGWRASRILSTASTPTITIGRNDPFFVSPNGAASNQIQYSFQGELGNQVNRGGQEDYTATLGATWHLPASWTVQGYGSYSQAIDQSWTVGLSNTAILSEALGNVPDNPLTAYSPARDGFFNPYTGVAANSAAVINALRGFTQNRERSQVVTGDLQADGNLFALPGGEVKLAIGVSGRHEFYTRHGINYTSTAIPTQVTGDTGGRSVEAVFTELRIPLFSEVNARPGFQALEFSAAVRAEHYSDFGWTVDPKVGLLWAPADDLHIRATYGRSFRAPGLTDLLDSVIISPIGLTTKARTNVETLAFQGGNPNLTPETADSYTIGFDYQPHWSPGSRLSLTWFETDYQNRISKPVISDIGDALTDPRFSPFVQFLDPVNNPADLARVKALLASPLATATAGGHLPTEYFAIVDLRAVNTGEVLIRGIDLDATHTLSMAGGDLSLRANGSWLLNYEQRLTPTAPISEFLGQVAFPAKFRGRASIDFTRGPYSVMGTANYVSGLHDIAGAKVDDQTTFDLQLRYRPTRGPFAGTTASLSVLNVFDAAPPFYNNASGFGFDATNYTDLGRVIRLQIAKSW